METAHRRLQLINGALRPLQWTRILILPDDTPIFTASLPSASTRIRVGGGDADAIQGDAVVEVDIHLTGPSVSLVLSAVGTEHEHDNPIPKYPVVSLIPLNTTISLEKFWAIIYALWTINHTQECIPITISPLLQNKQEILDYLISSGLVRMPLNKVGKGNEVLFLLRGTFWQGAGIAPTFPVHTSWLRDPHTIRTSTFPQTPSFTRTPLVIASHPLRPPKPSPGACLYNRYCTSVNKMFTLHLIDSGNEHHMNAFHQWHNDEKVSRGWGEQGSMEYHLDYVQKVLDDPSVLPLVMSWDGELMGYLEFMWVKENHMAPYVPDGAKDYDRTIHMLVGNEKYRGGEWTQAWFRSAAHFIFLCDPRTVRMLGEPKESNKAVEKLTKDAGMFIYTVFDFPYKRSALQTLTRENFFRLDSLL